MPATLTHYATLQVEEHHIRAAIQKSQIPQDRKNYQILSERCPLALAASGRFGKSFCAGNSAISDGKVKFELCNEGVKIRKLFDQGNFKFLLKNAPFSVELYAPSSLG